MCYSRVRAGEGNIIVVLVSKLAHAIGRVPDAPSFMLVSSSGGEKQKGVSVLQHLLSIHSIDSKLSHKAPSKRLAHFPTASC